MTVREMVQKLVMIEDQSLEVVVVLPESMDDNDYMCVSSVRESKGCSISNPCVDILGGRLFSY